MELQVGVKVLLENENGEVLLLRRSADMYKDVKDSWDVPGGRIQPEEDLHTALQREVYEETGITEFEAPRIMAAQDIFAGEEWHIVRLTYFSRVTNGQTVRLSEENEQFCWVVRDKLREMGG